MVNLDFHRQNVVCAKYAKGKPQLKLNFASNAAILENLTISVLRFCEKLNFCVTLRSGWLWSATGLKMVMKLFIRVLKKS